MMQIKRAGDLFPAILTDELLRVARIRRDWLEVIPDQREDRCGYSVRSRIPTWMSRMWTNGADAFGMWGDSIWLIDGPKLFYPTVAQCEALAQVEVGLTMEDYRQPYPALAVVFPDGWGAPFRACLCHLSDDGKFAGFGLVDPPSHKDGICITVGMGAASKRLEDVIQRYDQDCLDNAKQAGLAARIALNACLCLVNYGARRGLLFPKEAESDQRLGRENSPRGRKARQRLQTAPEVVTFDREVILHRTEVNHEGGDGEASGREVSTHWRRGHWRMQACGHNREERRRLFIKPTFVRADRFGGDVADTTTAYRG